MTTPGPKPLPLRFDPTDDTATKPASILWDPPEDGQSPYLYRWWGARYLLATDLIIAIVGLMTPRQMFIVHMRLQGLTNNQIATRMQLTPSAVRQNLVRLRQRIYEEIPDLRVRLIYCYGYQPPPP
jgi:DNA-directed RNA polymerase specialized sigma24 family protein